MTSPAKTTRSAIACLAAVAALERFAIGAADLGVVGVPADEDDLEVRVLAKQVGRGLEQDVDSLSTLEPADEQEPHAAVVASAPLDLAAAVANAVRDHPGRLERRRVEAVAGVVQRRLAVRDHEPGAGQGPVLELDRLMRVGKLAPRRMHRGDLLVGGVEREDRRECAIEPREQPLAVPQAARDELDPGLAAQPLDLALDDREPVEQAGQRRVAELGDPEVRVAEAVHPATVLEPDLGRRGGRGDDVDLVARSGELAGEVGRPAADPADLGRVLGRREAEAQCAAVGPQDSERAERGRIARGDLAAPALAARPELDPGLGRLLEAGGEPLVARRVDPPLGQLVAGDGPHRLDVGGVALEDLVDGVASEPVSEREAEPVLDRRVGVLDDAAVVADVALQVAVLDGGVRQRAERVAAVDQLEADVDLVEEVLDLLVEAADLGEPVAAEAAVRALQVEERIGTGPDVALERRPDVEPGLGRAVADRVLVLLGEPASS